MSPDLRNKYDQKITVIDGTLYRRGNIVQVFWDIASPQTWHLSNENAAIVKIKELSEDFNQEPDFQLDF